MTKVAVLGAVFDPAVDLLGLEPAGERPDVVLVDLRDAEAVARAAALPIDIHRIVVGSEEQMALVAALGATHAVARSCDPAALGPLLAAATPAAAGSRTRLIVVTGARGGIGRTLLVVNLAARVAARSSVLVVDATGTGAVGWWLRVEPGPWSDLEGLADELTSEHLGIVAAARERVRVVGGMSSMPSPALLAATGRAAVGLADLVIVDLPPIFDERTRAGIDLADRVILVAGEDAASLEAIGRCPEGERTWVVASRCRPALLGGRDVLHALPDDGGSVRSALAARSLVGGALGRAYDAVAELLAIDIE